MSKLAKQIADGVKSVLVEKKEYHLHEPYLDDKDAFEVNRVVKSGWVSSVGKEITKFEKELTDFTGANQTIATVNGTSALHICMQLAGVEEGDEVLCPTLTFVATANAISYLGAVPNFVDSEKNTLGICPQKLVNYLQSIVKISDGKIFNKQTGRKISAIVVTHIFGHPANLDALKAIADEYELPLIEDAAEALGSIYKKQHVGKTGMLSALSFNGNKIITTGGGGAILTQDKELAARARHLTTTAKLAHAYEYEHDEVAYNYRMPNLNAALGLAQMQKLPSFLNKKRTLAAAYKELFSQIEGAEFLDEPDGCTSNFWLNAIHIKSEGAFEILDYLHEQKIFARPIWKPMHMLAMYKDSPRDKLGVAENLYSSVINLPSGIGLIRG